MDKVEKIKNFLKDNPDDSFLKHALALEYVKVKDDEAAEKLFTEILGRDAGYVGSYYHLGKLLERKGREEDAIKIYEKGMAQAKAAGENHAYNELRAALEDLTF